MSYILGFIAYLGWNKKWYFMSVSQFYQFIKDFLCFAGFFGLKVQDNLSY